MSAEDFTNMDRAHRRITDPYATRPLAAHAVIDQSFDQPLPNTEPSPSVARRRPPRRRGNLFLTAFLSLLVIVGASALGGLYYLDRSYEGKIYPNVTVQGLPIGEMTPAEAEAALKAQYTKFLQNPATLTFNDKTWQPSPEQLGISFDFKGAIDQAYQAGRGNRMFENLQNIAAIWQDGLDLPLRVTFDQTVMQEYISGLRNELDITPIDAQLELDGLVVKTKPARTGRQLLIDETVQDLTSALKTFQPSTIALRTRELAPRLSDAEVEAAKQQINTILQGDLQLNVEGKSYTWTPEEIALMLQIARVPKDDSSDRIAVELNSYQINKRIVAIADETGRESVLPRVAWNNGDLRIIKPGVPGVRLDEAKAHDLIVAALNSSQRTLDLPTREVATQVTEENLHLIGIKELVSIGKSDFSGSAAYRVHNVVRGMEILNGILLAPGAEFSFNENIGEIDAANGFVEGYAIVQNRTQLEFGGGICQDSTTIYRAAFWAGLPITERWGHSFYINWYDKYGLGEYGDGMGMDATIFTGGPDFKFVNDTGHWLLIQAWANPQTGVAQVELYGTKPNRTVELVRRIYDHVPAPTEPVYVADASQPVGTRKQTDTARGGMTIDVHRIIIENGVRQEPELFRTRFKAWPNIFTVNPADLGPDGKPITPPEQPQPEQPQPEQTEQPEQPQFEQPQPEQPEQPQPEQPEVNG